MSSRDAQESAPSYDTWLVGSHLINSGFNVTFLPGGVVYADPKQADLAFIGLGASTSTFGGMLLTKKRPGIWSILGSAGVPVPVWKSFRVTGTRAAAAFAARIGYPVELGREKGERAWTANTEGELLEAMASFQAGPKSPHRRAVVRKVRAGRTFELLFLGDQLLLACRKEKSPQLMMPEAVHEGFVRLGAAALRAVPGLGFGAVRIEADDLEKDPGNQDARVVSVRSSPKLSDFGEATVETHAGVVAPIVDHHLQVAGVVPQDVANVSSMTIECRGLVATGEFWGGFSEEILDPERFEVLGAVDYSVDEVLRVGVRATGQDLARAAVTAIAGIGSEKRRAPMVSLTHL